MNISRISFEPITFPDAFHETPFGRSSKKVVTSVSKLNSAK